MRNSVGASPLDASSMSVTEWAGKAKSKRSPASSRADSLITTSVSWPTSLKAAMLAPSRVHTRASGAGAKPSMATVVVTGAVPCLLMTSNVSLDGASARGEDWPAPGRPSTAATTSRAGTEPLTRGPFATAADTR